LRLASFSSEGVASWGVVTSEGLVDVGRRLDRFPTLRIALSNGGVSEARTLVDSGVGVDHAIDAVQFEPVIPDAGVILCIGLNYDEHRLETKRESADHPTVFARYPRSQIGHGRAMICPPESFKFDYEGELAIVIGRSCRRVPLQDAMSVVAGYACYNDGSIRDYQRHTTQFHPGKNWPGTGAFGPWLVTADEVDDISELKIQTRLNGQVVQSAGLDQLIFTVPELIAYCSTWTDLHPGDVIVTGTPGGVGAARQPPLWMKAGDFVEVEISGVGLLANHIEMEGQ
jgi:2-keto-4-pentenoate hydratase/2-oxohepta-3-ene-1,7-dioic acid hydratase in catechol pathway